MQANAKHQELFHRVKMVGIMSLGLALLACLELYSAWYAYASAPKSDMWKVFGGEYPRAALIHTTLSIVCGILAFIGMAVAGALGDDIRQEYKNRAWSARIVAVMLLCVPHGPIANLASAFALDRQGAVFEVYSKTPAYKDDVVMIENARNPQGYVDPQELAEAKLRTTPPSIGEMSLGDWLVAVMFHVLTMLIASAFRLAPPITEAEFKLAEAERLAKIRSDRGKKGAKTRAQNAKKKGKAKPKRKRVRRYRIKKTANKPVPQGA